jgi:hypothetical protein
MRVTAKVSGYHPSSGNFLVEGQEYDIGEDAYSEEVFTRGTETKTEDEHAEG